MMNCQQPSGQVERASRFPIQVAMRYRESGSKTWYLGRTINISRTGVFFRAESDILAGTKLEMNISLPVGLGGSRGMSVVCFGPLVRKDISAGASALAARIQNYKLAPDPDATALFTPSKSD